jgi:phosphoribosyl 1,2-cyclic phosphodiesterase
LAQSDLSIRFWGVRGSIACPGPDTVRYGGNTSCVEIRCGHRLLIFDGGSGLRPLGNQLIAGGRTVDLDLFYSHTHLDHIVGLPFFQPAYSAGNHLRFWAGHLKPDLDIKTVIDKMMSAPLFPVPIDIMESKIEFRDFVAGDTLKPHPGIKIVTAPLNHPNGATGYRLE